MSGHPDRVGKREDNDRLSIARAWALRTRLLERAADEAWITVSGGGDREPAVPTADEVRGPRRVEVPVR